MVLRNTIARRSTTIPAGAALERLHACATVKPDAGNTWSQMRADKLRVQ